MADSAFACPVCRGPLEEANGGLSCEPCGRRYDVVDGVPCLLAHLDAHAAEQSRWFDEEVDEEYEITRPHGTPALYTWLLEEKFRRSAAGLELEGAQVLSVCAGSGMDAEFLARAGARVTAADISPRAAARSAERARRFGLSIAPVVADATRLPFADHSFDVVYVHDGLHHLEQPEAALAEMARVARHAVSVTEPARAGVTRLAIRMGLAQEEEDAGNRVARLSPEEVASDLGRHGFRVLRAERYAMYYKHEPGWAMRAFSRPVIFQLATLAHRGGSVLLNRYGNKLAVVAVRQ